MKKPLQIPYDGPFNVSRRTDKCYGVDTKGKPITISLDRLKLAFIAFKDDTQDDYPYSMEIKTEK